MHGDASVGFAGAKVMLFAGEHLVVIRRDDFAHIPWPNRLDFPGGGREGGETPEACVLRETREELGLDLSVHQLRHVMVRYTSQGAFHTFAAECPASIVDKIRFGDEGQGWSLIDPERYVSAPDGIPPFQHILALYLMEKTGTRAQAQRPGQ